MRNTINNCVIFFLATVYKPGRPGGGWDDSEDEEDVVIEVTSKESCASVDSIEFR